jgi:hypothetical protein
MNCEEARELIGAEPESASAQLLAHLETCADCRSYRAQMLVLNTNIRRALELSLPPAPQSKVVAFPGTSRADQAGVTRLKSRRPHGLAIAASLAAGLLVAITLWLGRPNESLAAEIVTHVEHEPDSWTRTATVSAAQLAAVLDRSGVKIGPGMGTVVYASSCWFRGRYVPHLVVSTPSGPVTVMILKSEPLESTQSFSEDGYSGLLVPSLGGAVAILSRTAMALDQPARDVARALEAGNH